LSYVGASFDRDYYTK